MDILSLTVMKRYVEQTLSGSGALAGKSAYDIACDLGFQGTPSEWLQSLQGQTPSIGPNGTWVIGGVDTNIDATPDLAGYATEIYVQELFSTINLPGEATDMIALSREEILEICN